MRSIDQLVRRVIIGCALILFAPQILVLVSHIIRDVTSQPNPVAISARSSGQNSGHFGFGVIVGLVVVVFVAGLVSRLSTLRRDHDPYRRAMERRARTMPRIVADLPDAPVDVIPLDDDADPALE